MAAPLAHPLIADYVHRGSRGKAIALCGMGIVCGEIIAISMFKLNTMLNMSFYDSFTVSSFLIFLSSLYFLWAIKDPDLKHLHVQIKNQKSLTGESVQFDDLSIKDKMMKFTRIVKKELKKKPILTTCLLGASITRLLSVLFSTYLILWI